MRIDFPRRGRTGVLRFVPSWRQVLSLLALGLLGLLAVAGVGYAMVDIPPENPEATAQASVVTYADGRELGRFGAQNRRAVRAEDLPEHVKRAVLAAEDRGFYENRGVSPTAILRSAWNNLTSGSTQGGSTITQQFVKNVYLTQERTYTRKAREFVIALKVDRQRSKHEILESYLNTIYWGRSAYGVQTAAQSYFGVAAEDLTVSQAAYLAGIIQSPGSYDPAENPQGARRRWAYVLDGMVAEGWLAADERAGQRFPKLVEHRREDRLRGPRGHLLDTVRRELRAAGFIDQDIDFGGLRVITTFDRRAQRAAVAAVREESADETPEDIDLRAALVAVRPGSGAVAAMYGGPDYVRRQFNDAVQGRTQPGSTFKPFALAAALEDGIGLRSRYDGTSGRSFPEYAAGRPVPNFGGESFGQIDLLTATAHSVNTVYVDLGLDVGPRKVVDAAVRAGIPRDTPDLNANPSVVLGVAGVHPVDLAEAYATFAARGVHADWFTVREVRDADGEVVYRGKPRTKRVFDPDVMADVSYALQGVVTDGSGFEARNLGRPSAGKTGTTNNNRSAWYVGYVPQLAAAVALWDESDPASLRGYGGADTVTGGSFPARIWTAFMSAALDGATVEPFPGPAFVGVDENTQPTPSGPPTETDGPTEEPTEEPTETPSEQPEPTPSPTPTPTPRPTGSAEPTPTDRPRPSGRPTSPTQPPPRPAPSVTRTTQPPALPLPPGEGGGGGGGPGEGEALEPAAEASPA